jgi:selenocysteine-specific elongation factor
VTELTVGTAGHVDHGKTALVKALTGIDCDTTAQERARSMTMQLGFASWTLPSGREVSIVDVPGHERFIRTMAFGARSIDLALLCVAVDDGVMPQTKEHLAVLRLLGVRDVVVLLTKADLAPEQVPARAAQTVDLVTSLGLNAGAWIACSVVSGVGLDQVPTVVDSQLTRLPAPLDRGLPRLLVDRSFSRPGTGTVVTGVLDGGGLHVGQAVEVFPSARPGRVHGLQRRGVSVREASAGGRLAVALHSVALADVPRGSVVGLPGSGRGATAVDCVLDVPAVGCRGVRQGMHLEVLCGTSSTAARLWLAGEAELAPGSSGYAQLHLESAIWALPGDLMVLRAPGPETVLGGAMVLDANPRRHRRWGTAPLDGWTIRERLLRQGDVQGLDTLCHLEVTNSSLGLEVEEVAGRVGLAAERVRTALTRQAEEGHLVRVSARFMARQRWQGISATATSALEQYEREHPLDPGMPRQRLVQLLGLPLGPVGEAGLRLLQEGGALRLQGPVAASPSRPSGNRLAGTADRVLAGLRHAGRTPPTMNELRQWGLTKELRSYLIRSGAVVELTADLLFEADSFRQLEADLSSLLEGAGAQGLTVAEIRDGLHSSRRSVVPLLERWEREGRAERHGDLHRLKRSL